MRRRYSTLNEIGNRSPQNPRRQLEDLQRRTAVQAQKNVLAADLDEIAPISYGNDNSMVAEYVPYDRRFMYPAISDYTPNTSSWALSAIGAGSEAGIDDEANHPGIRQITQSGANTGAYSRSANANRTVFQGGETMELVFRPLTTSTALRMRIGFTNTITTSAPTAGIWWDLDSAFTIQYNYDNGTEAPTTTTTSTSFTADTWYRAFVRVSEDGFNIEYIMYYDDGSIFLGPYQIDTSGFWAGTWPAVSPVYQFYKTTAGTINLVDVDWVAYYNSKQMQR